MSKIKILPEILSNKIAAGEVVERPASVVKELIENSLDAGSTRIVIDVEKGGRNLIRVSDNGFGMTRDDALLSTERYGTSKIFSSDDLFSIKTLGFRGEALPSIASVSRFTLETKEKSDEVGTRIFIEGGVIKNVSDVGIPTGTLISVRNLFFNTPVRQKFMKTVGTETGHIADTVSGIALGWPGVQFRLRHNGKTVKRWSAAPDPSERVRDVLGKDTKNGLHRVAFDDNEISVSGWIAAPGITRATSRAIYVYVNGRFVRDRIIQHALAEGYGGRLMKGQFPLAVLFITLPPDQVDVNVHPRKNEVRFMRQNRVHNLVSVGISTFLNQADQPRMVQPSSSPAADWRENEVMPEPEQPRISEPSPESRGRPLCEQVTETIPCPAPASPDTEPNMKKDEKAGQTPIWQRRPFGDMKIIGQFHGTYILCESDGGLVLIDQHAAHERILFEQLLKRTAGAQNASQKLLIPETIDLCHSESVILEKLIPSLGESGLEIEPFGGNTFVIKSVPAILIHREIRPLIVEMTEKAADIGFSQGIENKISVCLMLMACHGAIRANQQLSGEQMKVLLGQLDECENPSHCPHGRPTWIKWGKHFFEKSFRRIV